MNGQTAAWHNLAAVAVLDVGTKTLRFKQFIKGPFSASKFVIRRDYNSSRNGFRILV